MVFSDNEFDQKILFEWLQCVRTVSQQLGKTSSAVYYELLVSAPHLSSEDIVARILKVLETGHSSFITAMQMSELGVDNAWEKELSSHRRLRKFSTSMFLSLNALCQKANSWGNVLDVVQSYVKFLVPQKVVLNLDPDAVFHVNYSPIVQSISQIAKVMFESVLDVLVLLSFMTCISGQVSLFIVLYLFELVGVNVCYATCSSCMQKICRTMIVNFSLGLIYDTCSPHHN